MSIVSLPLPPAAGAAHTFWQTLPLGQHLILLHSNEENLLDNVADFVSVGLLMGEGVMVQVTTPQRVGLQLRLLQKGLDLESAQARGQYQVLELATLLAHLRGQRGTELQHFAEFVSPLLAQVVAGGRRGRVFSSLSSALWAAGRLGLAFQEEQLAEKFCAATGLVLLCAYPLQDFWPSQASALQELCMRHTRKLYA